VFTDDPADLPFQRRVRPYIASNPVDDQVTYWGGKYGPLCESCRASGGPHTPVLPPALACGVRVVVLAYH
jgi:hypothetical protein